MTNKAQYDKGYEAIFGKPKPRKIFKKEIIKTKVETTGKIIIKCGEGTKTEQKRWFKNDTLQPYTKDNKINGQFVKVYGKENHPAFNKEL